MPYVIVFLTVFALAWLNGESSPQPIVAQPQSTDVGVVASTAAQAAPVLSKPPVDLPTLANVTVAGQAWRRDAFGTVAILNFIDIRNKSDAPVKDIQILCDMYGNSGTHIVSKRHTIYESVHARRLETFNEVNLGFAHNQATRMNCSVVSFATAR